MYDIFYWIYTSVFGLIYGRESFSQNCEATALRSAIKKIRHATYETAKYSSLVIPSSYHFTITNGTNKISRKNKMLTPENLISSNVAFSFSVVVTTNKFIIS